MFSANYQLLEQESLVVRSCLCTGFTELRNTNLNNKGRCYTAFFQLATGIERMAKLALILDHMGQNNLLPPGTQGVRNYGHDLEKLFGKVKETSQVRGYTLGNSFTLSPLSARMLKFLSEFATGMRYANLDALASGKAQRKPLQEWDHILQEAMASQVPAKTNQRVIQQSIAIANAIQDVSIVNANDLADIPLSMATALSKPKQMDYAAKHLVLELLSLLAPLCDFIVKSGHNAEQTAVARSGNTIHIPNMREFFYFIWLDRELVLRKKRWP